MISEFKQGNILIINFQHCALLLNILMVRYCELSPVLSHFSRVWLFATPWTVARQAPLSMGFFRQEYAVDCHFLLQGTFLTQGSNLGLLNCRQILYPLNHQPGPTLTLISENFQEYPCLRPLAPERRKTFSSKWLIKSFFLIPGLTVSQDDWFQKFLLFSGNSILTFTYCVLERRI